MAGDLYTLFKLLFTHGKLSSRKALVLIFYLVRTAFCLPFGCLEYLFYHRRIACTPIHPEPVFIIGHQRTGTTFLQKMLSSDPRFGYLPNMELFFPFYLPWARKLLKNFFQRFIRFFRIKNIFFNDLPLSLDDPTEEEMYLAALPSAYSLYLSFVFPHHALRYFRHLSENPDAKWGSAWQKQYLDLLRKLSLLHGCRPLVLKNPANCTRISLLLKLFPDARFVYIHRNPYYVYYSMRRLWDQVIQRYVALQHTGSHQRDQLLFQHFRLLNDAYERDKKLIPAGHSVEVQYKDLIRNPLETLRYVYQTLSLPDFEAARPFMERLMEKEGHYRAQQYIFEETKIREIYREWRQYIDRWEDEPPPMIKK